MSIRNATKLAAWFFCAGAVLAHASWAHASCTTPTMQCKAATDQDSASLSGAWAFGCVPGFVLADDNANSSAAISMTMGASSLDIKQVITSSGCCVAPYANIGSFDGCQASDQWNQPGSHLPLQIKDIASLTGAWTFKVQVPLSPNYLVSQYRVYFEIFLSPTAAGAATAGNITLDFFWNNYAWASTTGHAPINGPQGMNYIDEGANPFGQGPFVDFLYPGGTFAPDSSGVVTVPSTDVKAVLDWAVANFPKYYTGDLYLSSLSLAVEAGAMHETVETTFVSFAVEKSGSPTVYTPPFTSGYWDSDGGVSGSSDGGSSSGSSSDGGSSGSGSSSGAASSGSSGSGSSSGSGASSSGAPTVDAGDKGAGATTGNNDAPSSAASCGCRLAGGEGSQLRWLWAVVGLAALVGRHALGRSRRRINGGR